MPFSKAYEALITFMRCSFRRFQYTDDSHDWGVTATFARTRNKKQDEIGQGWVLNCAICKCLLVYFPVNHAVSPSLQSSLRRASGEWRGIQNQANHKKPSARSQWVMFTFFLRYEISKLEASTLKGFTMVPFTAIDFIQKHARSNNLFYLFYERFTTYTKHIKITKKDCYKKDLQNTPSKHILQTHSQIIYQPTTLYKMVQNVQKCAYLKAFYEYGDESAEAILHQIAQSQVTRD